MENFAEFFAGVKDFIMGVLPLSPFTSVIESLEQLPFLGYLNWFFPVGACLDIFSAWLIAYGAYLGISILLRWAKVVGE